MLISLVDVSIGNVLIKIRAIISGICVRLIFVIQTKVSGLLTLVQVLKFHLGFFVENILRHLF